MGEYAPAAEVLRQMVGTLVKDTIRGEFERFLGAARDERTPARRGHRNGSYSAAAPTSFASSRTRPVCCAS